MANLLRQRLADERDGNRISSNAQETVDETDLLPPHAGGVRHERSSSDSSVNSTDSALSNLIPAYVWKVVSFDTLPKWLRDNEYLKHGHRPPLNSFKKCFGSIFRMHTETWNIWTHLIGALFFIMMAFCAYVLGTTEIAMLPWKEQVIIGVFFLSAIGCLCLSMLFHTFCSHSEKVARFFVCLDYSGITLLITGSCVPCYYFTFYCASFSRYLHLIILISLCAMCLVCSFWKKFGTPAYRPFRTVVFIMFGFYSFVPGIQIVLQEGLSDDNTFRSIVGLLIMASIYVGGASLYAARIPERFFPGKFDIWASSHQLFHICVIVGAYVHYDVILHMVSHRLSIGLDNCLPASVAMYE